MFHQTTVAPSFTGPNHHRVFSLHWMSFKLLVAGLLVGGSCTLRADLDLLPPGYSIKLVSSNVTATSISQLAFKPGELTRVYAARSSPSRVSRYDFDPVNGLLSNEFTVATNVDNREMIGLGFHSTNLYVTFDYGGSRTIRPGDGRLSRFMHADSNGVFRARHDFVYGLNKGDHDLNQIQILGDSLYLGIGGVGRVGNPMQENIYSMTIARIVDLNQIVSNTNQIGANFKGPINYLASPSEWTNTAGADGQLRYFASGFRNPFGICFDPQGKLWVSVNGNSDVGFLSDDLVYRDVTLGSQGDFPPPAWGYTNYITGTPIVPFINLGLSPSPTGFDFIRFGPDAGKIIMGEAGATQIASNGRDLLLIDATTGNWQQIYQFTTNVPVSTITDVVSDAFGRLFITDYSRNNIWRLTPPLPTPALTAALTDEGLRLSWPLFGVEYQLEESAELPPNANWHPSAASIQTNLADIAATLSVTNGSRYFRLRK